MLPRVRIAGTGSYVPERVLTNLDLSKMVETSDEWITERTGIKERHIARPDQAASDLALEAAKAALKAANTKPSELDLIIVATATPDMAFPSTGCILQQKLGAKNAAAFDLSAACSGFLYSLGVASGFIRSGMNKKVLVVGCEVLSRITDWNDRTTCVLFGDGAGAVVLEPSPDKHGIQSVSMRSDGAFADLLMVPGGGSCNPASQATVDSGLHCIKMRGNETFKVAVKSMEAIALETLAQNGLEKSDLSLLIPHQANMRIIQAIANRIELPMEKVYVNLMRYGNTSAASIPIALDEAVREGRIKRDDNVMLIAFGGGLTWASALIKW